MRKARGVIALLVLLTSTASGSLYFWNDQKRPPISLAEAMKQAEDLLGEDAENRYCVAVHLWGDAHGEGKNGTWNLLYAAADGSKKHVYIGMDGRRKVERWNGPVKWGEGPGTPIGIVDLRDRLQKLLEKEGIRAQIDLLDEKLTVNYRVRTYQVYAQRDDGSFAKELEEATGPESDGLWISVSVVDKPDMTAYESEGPYWRWERGTYPLPNFAAAPNRFLAVDFRWGRDANPELVQQVLRCFGTKTGRP